MRLQVTTPGRSIAILTGMAAVGLPSLAFAQTPSPATQPPVIQPLPTAPAPAPSAQPPVIQPLPPSAPVEQFTPPPPMAPPPPVAQPQPPADAGGLQLSAFVDGYYAFQTQRRQTPSPFHRGYVFNVPLVNDEGDLEGFGAENGFSLSFAGIDAVYEAGPISATISLRGGPSVPIYYGGDTGALGIENVTQAYASWSPIPQLTLDLGQFGTIFGAEVAESWQNLNYTRGALYYAMQPFWHTGLRATMSPSDQVAITAMVVNGVNTITDDNNSPSLALQLGLTPNETFSLAAGWYNTPSRRTDQGSFDNFFDLVASLTVDRFTLVFNADLAVNQSVERATPEYEQTVETPIFWGASLALGYQATETFGLALRAEFLSDADNQLYLVEDQQILPGTGLPVTYPATTQTNLATITGTLDFKPVKGSDNLVIRWDNRVETSNRDIFFNRARNPEPADVWFGSTIGVVVKTGG